MFLKVLVCYDEGITLTLGAWKTGGTKEPAREWALVCHEVISQIKRMTSITVNFVNRFLFIIMFLS